MLRWRILLGAVLIGALLGLCWLDAVTTPAAWLLGLTLLVGLAAEQELIALLESAGYEPLGGAMYGGAALVIVSNAIALFWFERGDDHAIERLAWPLVAFTLAVLVVLAGEMRRYARPGGTTVNIALATFAIFYVGVLLSFALQLRMLGGPVEGMTALASLVLVVKMGDTGAYTVGRLIGRHKMSPVISPGKTLEGAAGALAFACLGAWIGLAWLGPHLGASAPRHAWSWILFGLAVGAAGIAGDLAESLLKRDLGSKDSSSWMPGFGGVLDVVDSILVAAPVAYCCRLLELSWP